MNSDCFDCSAAKQKDSTGHPSAHPADRLIDHLSENDLSRQRQCISPGRFTRFTRARTLVWIFQTFPGNGKIPRTWVIERRWRKRNFTRQRLRPEIDTCHRPPLVERLFECRICLYHPRSISSALTIKRLAFFPSVLREMRDSCRTRVAKRYIRYDASEVTSGFFKFK